MSDYPVFAEEKRSVCTCDTAHEARSDPEMADVYYLPPEMCKTLSIFNHVPTEKLVGGTKKTTINGAPIWVNNGASYLQKLSRGMPEPPAGSQGTKSLTYLGDAWPAPGAGAPTVRAEGHPVMRMKDSTWQNTAGGGAPKNCDGFVDDAENVQKIRDRIAGVVGKGEVDIGLLESKGVLVDGGGCELPPEETDPDESCALLELELECSHTGVRRGPGGATGQARSVTVDNSREKAVLMVVAGEGGDEVSLAATVRDPCDKHVTWGTPSKLPDAPAGASSSVVVPAPPLHGLQEDVLQRWLYLRNYKGVDYRIAPLACAGADLSAFVRAYPDQSIDASVADTVEGLVKNAVKTIADTQWGGKTLEWVRSVLKWFANQMAYLRDAFEEAKQKYREWSWALIPGLNHYMANANPFKGPAGFVRAIYNSVRNVTLPEPIRDVLEGIDVGIEVQWREWYDHRAYLYEVVEVGSLGSKRVDIPQLPVGGWFSIYSWVEIQFDGGKVGKMEPGDGWKGLGGHLKGLLEPHIGFGLNTSWASKLDWLEAEANITASIETMVQVVIVNSDDEKLRIYLGPTDFIPVSSRGAFKINVEPLLGGFTLKAGKGKGGSKDVALERNDGEDFNVDIQRDGGGKEGQEDESWLDWGESVLEGKAKEKVLEVAQAVADKVSFEIDNPDIFGFRMHISDRLEFRFL